MSRRNELSQRLAFLLRSNPTLLSRFPAHDGFDEPDVLLAEDGAAQPAVDVSGRYYHAVQVRELDGTDNWKVQGALDGVNFHDITGLTALAANGITQFTGVFRALKAVRNSGTGVATDIVLMSMRS